MVKLIKITPNERIIEERHLKSVFPQSVINYTHTRQSLVLPNNRITLKLCSFFLCKGDLYNFNSHNFFEIQKLLHKTLLFTLGNKGNTRSRGMESQYSDRNENTSETSFTQVNATSVDVSEIVNNIFDRNLDSKLTKTTEISFEIEAISQRLYEQNHTKLTLSNN